MGEVEATSVTFSLLVVIMKNVGLINMQSFYVCPCCGLLVFQSVVCPGINNSVRLYLYEI